MSVQPGTRLGHYEILSAIGKGGMGEVWKARDTTLRRHVAIKTLPAELARDAERLTRLEREAELLATLNHPNVATIHGLEAHDGTRFLVLELVEGDTLDDRIRRGAIPVRDSLALALQIAQALEAAHQHNVIHRDLKPANIKITPDGRIKVLDFGLGKALAPPPNVVSTHAFDPTEAGIVMGTPAYMSPEQARGEAVGVQADIWSFGAVVYEMLTGRSPFARQTLAETLASVLDAQPDYSALPSDTPPLARRLIERCLAKDPKRRLQHMGDVRIDLEDALAAYGSASDLVSTTTVAGGVPRRKALIYGASSVALLVSGLAGGMLVDRQLRHSIQPSLRRLTFRRGVIRSARFLPDGQTILYGALWDGDRCRVHSVRVDNPESRPLELPDANVLAISRSGDVALALGSHLDGGVTYGTLARIPIAGGAPRPILDDVKFADWSPDGADLAIVRRVDGRDRLEFPIGKILVQPAVGESTGLGFARVSSDGRHVAFVHYRSPTNLAGKVGIVDQTGRVTALSNDYLNIHGLAWKGGEIWYTAADERPLFRALCAVTPGGKQRVITRTPGNATLWDVASDGRVVLAYTDDRSVAIARLPGDVNDRDLSWLDATVVADLSRDGRMLLFSENGQGGGAGFSTYLRGTDGSSAVRLGAGRAAALSPDTRWALAFSGTGPSPQLDLLPTGVGEARRIPGNGLAYTTARWLPDGNRIIISAAEPGQQPRLYVQELEQGRQHPLTPVGVTSWAISPEGSMIAARGPGPIIRIYPVDGTAPRDVPGLTGREVPVAWISDGLLVMRPGDASSPFGEVYRVDLKTGQLQSWRNILPRDRAGILNFMSFRVTPDGRTLAYSWHRAQSDLYVADGLA